MPVGHCRRSHIAEAGEAVEPADLASFGSYGDDTSAYPYGARSRGDHSFEKLPGSLRGGEGDHVALPVAITTREQSVEAGTNEYHQVAGRETRFHAVAIDYSYSHA